MHRVDLDNFLKPGVRDGTNRVESFGVDVKSMGGKTNETINLLFVVVDPLLILFSTLGHDIRTCSKEDYG